MFVKELMSIPCGQTPTGMVVITDSIQKLVCGNWRKPFKVAVCHCYCKFYLILGSPRYYTIPYLHVGRKQTYGNSCARTIAVRVRQDAAIPCTHGWTFCEAWWYPYNHCTMKPSVYIRMARTMLQIIKRATRQLWIFS